jgi:lipopolysaccharide transport system ATP-binding protein
MTKVISVENLSKIYRLGQIGTGTLSLDLNVWWAKMRGKPNPMLRIGETDHGNCEGEELWALRDVSFSVEQGEVLGIIGRNGAGKSTLLKILSRVTAPTSGLVKVKGRVASLLEVGTGFHPELTGRENTYLNGAILGMKKAEIDRKFDEIVDFSEVEKFIDTPVKRYSSGMYVRLAFAVAAHLESEILLVDEVLAVGDAEFQKKCLGKMGDVASKEGRTVLFVSHNMSSIVSLCSSAIWIQQGQIALEGKVQSVTEKYLESIVTARESVDLRHTKERRGSGESRIAEAHVLGSNLKPSGIFRYGDDIVFEFLIERYSVVMDLLCVVWIRTAMGVPVLHLVNRDDPNWRGMGETPLVKVRCQLSNCQLYPGAYLVSLYIGTSHYHAVDDVVDVLQFQVEQGKLMDRGFDMNWTIGIYHSNSIWSCSNYTSF